MKIEKCVRIFHLNNEEISNENKYKFAAFAIEEKK